MILEDRFINAVSARLMDTMAFSVLNIEGRDAPDALVRIKERGLELIFFIKNQNNPGYVYNSQLAGIKEYMGRMNCDRARIVNVFLTQSKNIHNKEQYNDFYDNISLSRIWVNIERGMVTGDTSGFTRLVPLLERYADVSRLERHKPVDLRKLYKIDVHAKPIVTYGIIGINILVWILMTLAGGSTNINVLVKFGAMYAPLVIMGQYWRFITPMFLHIGLMHLAFNSYALYNLGSLAEKIYGSARFVIIYAVAGITGSVFSFLFTWAVSAGASGAIFGLLGALLYFGRKRPGVFKKGFTANLVGILLINLFIGFSSSGIDNFAHIGGFIGGYISSHIVWHKVYK